MGYSNKCRYLIHAFITNKFFKYQPLMFIYRFVKSFNTYKCISWSHPSKISSCDMSLSFFHSHNLPPSKQLHLLRRIYIKYYEQEEQKKIIQEKEKQKKTDRY